MKSSITLAIKAIAICLFAISLSQQLKAQTIIYVDSANVSGTYNGTSWATAYNNFATALSAATSGNQIWVAKGTYQTAASSTFAVTIDNIDIYGGFYDTATLLTSRNYPTNLTILKGNGASVLSYSSAITNATTLDGFTITNGTGTGTTGAASGGGISMVSASPTLNNIIISSNTAANGGGINMSGSSSPVLTNITFTTNSATTAGGGVYLAGTGSPTFTSVTFTSNTATGAGNPTTANLVNGGGGMFVTGTGTATLTNAIFQKNTAPSSQGGAMMQANSTIGGTVTINRAVFYANSALYGGGIYDIRPQAFNIINTLFAYDTCTANSNYMAGAVSDNNTGVTSVLSILDCTFYNNFSAGPNHDIRYLNATANNVISNTLFFHTGEITTSALIGLNLTTSPVITYSYFPYYNGLTTSATNVVSTANPFFNVTDPMSLSNMQGADGLWMTADDGLELSKTSTAYNSGSNSLAAGVPTDITGNTRIINVVDMGAYESGLGFSLQPVSQIICPGSSQTITFTATAVSSVTNDAITLQWKKNGVNVGSPVVLSAPPYNTSYTINPATTNDTASYTVVASDATYGSVTSTVATISTYLQQAVLPATQTVCSGAATATPLVATSRNSNTSNIVQWEYSYSNFGSVGDSINIGSSASSTLTALQIKLTDSTTAYYRALVQNPGCAASYSDTVLIKVTGSDTAYQAQAICTGTAPANLTINDSAYAVVKGAIAKWQYSTSPTFSNYATITAITNTKFSLTSGQMGALTANRYYRAVITSNASSGCTNKTAYSNVIAIAINATSVGGTASTTTPTICSGSTATVTLAGYTGTIQWQTNASGSYVDIPGATSPSYTTPVLTNTTSYQAVVTNGACSSANSSAQTITVNATSVGGTASTTTPTICSGSTATVTLAGYTGIIQWQTNASGSYVDIPGATSTSYITPVLTNTTSYQAVVTNGVCSSTNSSVQTITVNATSVGGTPNPAQSICTGSSPADLTLSGNTGSVNNWQYSSDNFSMDTHDIAETSTTLSSATMGALTANTYYRAVVQSGVCAAANSASVLITIAVPGGGFTPSGQSICPNTTPADILLSGYTGTISKWQYSIDSFASDVHDIASSASATLTGAQMGMLSANTYYRAIVVVGSCSSAQSPVVLVSVLNNYTWTGATNTDWNTAGNWSCNTIPKLSTDVSIPSGLTNYPIVGTTPSGLIHNITIANGASVVVNSGDTLKISGAISNAGSLDVQAGTIELKGGSTPQTIAGSMFVAGTINTLVIKDSVATVSNAAGDTLKIANVLSFGNINNATLYTGDNIDLLSDCSSITARVADLTNGGANSGNAINGKVTVERCIPAHRAWRFLTAPISNSNTIYNSWQNNGEYIPGEGTLITMPAPASNGMDAGINTNYSMVTFNPATQTFVNFSNTQQPISPGSNGSADNMGYMIFVRGDRDPANVMNPNWGTPPTHVTVLSSFGDLQTYSQVFTAQTTAGAFTAIGNPYASPIDLNYITLDNVIKRFYTWDPNLNQVGGYVVLDDIDNNGTFTIVPSSAQTQVLQSGQAFFVQTEAAGPASITLNEGAKTSSDNILVFRPANVLPSMQAELDLLNSDSTTTYVDGALARYSNTYSAGVDWQDAPKLSNINEGIGLSRSARTLSIERRPLITGTDTLYLKLIGTTARSYQLKFNASNLQQPGMAAVLIDNYLTTQTALDLSGATSINFNVTGVAASAASNRFKVVFNASGILPVTFTSIAAARKDAVVAVNWSVSNESNTAAYEIERSTDGTNFMKATLLTATGKGIYQWIDSSATTAIVYYRIMAIDNSNTIAYSNMVKVSAIETAHSITLPDNNYNEGNLEFKFTNMPGGNYTARLLSMSGQLIAQRRIQYAGGVSNVPVDFGVAIAKGISIVEIVCTNGSNQFFKVNIY